MAQDGVGYPTERELEVLRIIWLDGPRTLRQVYDAQLPTKKTGIKSLFTIMSIMVKKCYLHLERRSKAEGGNLYTARVTQSSTARGMLQSLSSRLFGSSVAQAILNLANAGELDPKELRELRNSLNDLTKKKGK
jgi:predicted transcriptional regulator